MQALSSQSGSSVSQGLYYSNLQHANGKNTADSELLPNIHLQLSDARERDEQDNKIAEHVENSSGEEELGQVDAFALGTDVLAPEVRGRLAARDSCHPHVNGVGEGKKPAKHGGPFQVWFHGREDALVEAQDREPRAGAASCVNHGVRE